PPKEGFPKAKTYAKKALEIDDTLAEAHAALGYISMFYDWNREAAEREFKKALRLNPNSANAHLHYSQFLTVTGQHERAIVEAKKGREIDPLSNFANSMVGSAIRYSGQYDKAIEELQKTLKMFPDYYHPRFQLAMAYRGKMMLEDSRVEWEKAVELTRGAPFIVMGLAVINDELGNKAQADELFDSLKQRAEHEYVPPMSFFYFHVIRDELDKACEWLERACEERDSILTFSSVEPCYRIPDEPRFNEILNRYGLR
ncbi:MAG: tetratricopeptide repeat protein, partial [Candidatus Hodarchaeota archaeon]